MNLKMKIYAWLFKKSKSMYKEEHLKHHHSDIKCPQCNEWFSISGIEHKHNNSYIEDIDIYSCYCGKCGHTSYWNPNISMFLVLCDEKGHPL